MSVNSEYLIRKKNRIFHDVDNGRMNFGFSIPGLHFNRF